MSGGQSPPNPQTNNESDGESSASSPMPAPRGVVGQGSGRHFGTSGSAIPDPGLCFGNSSSARRGLGLHLGASGSALPDIGLNLGAPSSLAGPSGVRPPHQINIWPHLHARIRMPQHPPQVRPRALSPLPYPAVDIVDKNKWQCAVCNICFYNMKALSGHMKVHKDRGWRGIYPPPEFCRPPLGLHMGRNYPPPVSSDNLRIGGGGSCNLELSLGTPQPVFRRLPSLPIVAAINRNETGENVLGKRRASPESGQSSKGDDKSKRPLEGGVLDLNVLPPSDNSDEGSSDKPNEGGDAGGSTPT